MSTPLFVLVVEIIVVLAGLVALLLFFRWKTKQIKTKALEELMEDMTSMEDSRQQLLFQHLQKGYALENKKAMEASVQLINAEKHFMQLFIQQQIEQSSISDFYQTLCELLDLYLNTIPTLSSPDLNLAASMVEPENEDYLLIEAQEENIEEHKQVEQNKLQDEAKAEEQLPEIDEAEPDWDDAFSESGDEMDEASEESVANESVTDAEMDKNVDEEEVNWDDAFSESGDEMDASSKESFESETTADSEIEIDNNEEEEINWDDAFSESGDAMDEASKQEMESEQKKES